MGTYSGRWNHVYKLWKNATSQENFPQFDRWLSNEFAKNSKYGSKDRRWYSEVLFAAVRHGYFALFCNNLYLASKQFSLNTLTVEQFAKKYSCINEIFNGFKTIQPEDFFTWVYLRYQQSTHLQMKTESIGNDYSQIIPEEKKTFFSTLVKTREENDSLEFKLLFHSVPLWFVPYLNERIQLSKLNEEQIQKFLNNLDFRPPLWIRINHLDKKEEIIQELKNENYVVENFDSTLQVTGAKGVFTLNSYRNGLIEIQDLASQKIGEQIKIEAKQYAWDCCAGGGGKTLQIASLLKNKGVIYASDIREYKLEEVKKRAKRSGFFNIRCLTWNGESLPQFQKEVQIKGGFDWVLVDAPCSSSGTWRRNPDAKYRANKENIDNLSELQLKILSQASEAVIKNGHIVYSTCSWIMEENEGVVERFLQTHPDFILVKQNLFGSPFENSDTMFAAVLKKNAGPQLI